MKNLLSHLHFFFCKMKVFLQGKKYLAECGHETKQTDFVRAFGETIQTKVLIINGKIEYCHKCLEKMVVKCPWCGRPIFIGDMVTLYSPTKKEYQVPVGTVVFCEDPLTLVGCQRSDCAESGADYAGQWIPPGVVRRQPSGIEMALANPGCAIIGNANKKGGMDFKVIEPRL
jgi:hypothetical protein